MSTNACHNCDRPTADGSLVCTTCIGTLVADLRAVPGLVDDMTVTRARLDRMSRGRNGGKSAETALPVRLDKYDQRPTDRPLDALNNTVLTWAQDFADYLGVDLYAIFTAPGLRVITGYARGGRLGDNATVSTEAFLAIELAAIWMAHHPNDLRHHPAADELFDDITDAVADARRAVDRLPDLSYKGPCAYTTTDNRGEIRTCGRDLYIERGEDFARCPACGAHYDVRQLDRQILARMHEMVYTTTELIALLNELGHRVPKGTVHTWAARRRMAPRGWKHNGRITDHWIHQNDPAVYRLGDALALIEERDRASASA